MDLKSEVLTIVQQAELSLNVRRVATELALRIESEIRSAPNAIADEVQIKCNRGAAGFKYN